MKIKKTYVYLLRCPETKQVRYVGKSTNPKARYKTHIEESKERQNTSKKKWIFDLLQRGTWPTLEINGVFFSDEKAREAESKLCHVHLETIFNIHDPAKGAKDLKKTSK